MVAKDLIRNAFPASTTFTSLNFGLNDSCLCLLHYLESLVLCNVECPECPLDSLTATPASTSHVHTLTQLANDDEDEPKRQALLPLSNNHAHCRSHNKLI